MAGYDERVSGSEIRRIEWALRERVKELTCLYGIARVTEQADLPLEQALQAIVQLLPPAWQYPDIACARIVLDQRKYATPGFREGKQRQVASVTVSGVPRGTVEVVYTRASASTAEAAFLVEEQSLIEMVAQEVGLLVERRETLESRLRLEQQLRHADRLATIGQLAAGVAHELNEPLANILGYAQLAQKTGHLPKQTDADLEKIVRNCLYAREIIQKLLMFARQMPPEKARVNLNQVVTDGLYFLESRCAKAGIQVVKELDPDLPEIFADASQLQQVIVNLVVNALQAMSNGGRVTLATQSAEDYVSLIVRDTGVGMTEEVKSKIFTPFYTTKEVHEGTGLGLAVVHGIVTSHGGSIQVESTPGRGSSFEIRVPIGGAGGEDRP